MKEKSAPWVLLMVVATVLLMVGSIPLVSNTAHGVEDNTIHEFEGDTFTIDAEIATDGSGNELNRNGQVTYNVTVSGVVPKDVYPYIYPINVSYRNEATGEIVGTETIYLSPTRTPGFVPDSVTDSDRVVQPRELNRNYQVTIAFQGLFNRSVTSDKSVTFIAESRLTPDRDTQTLTETVDGPLPEGVSNGFVEKGVGLDEKSSVTFVDTFRISRSSQSVQFQESGNLPELSGHTYDGRIDSFSKMSEPGSGGARLYGESGGFDMVTLTRNIESAEPQTVVITYDVQNGEQINITPVDSEGRPINQQSDYILPEDPGTEENCRTVPNTQGDLCIFTLNSSTVSEVNRLGELTLHYEGTESLTGTIYCQSVVSGYMTSSTETCGTDSTIDAPRLVSFETFSGNVSEDQSRNRFASPVVRFDRTEVSYPVDLQMNLTPNVSGEPENLDIYYKVYNSRDIADNGEVTGSTVKEGTFQYDGSSPEPDPQSLEFEISGVDSDRFTDGEETYLAVLCTSSSDCNATSNEVSSSLVFTTEYDPEIPVLVPQSPETVELSVTSTREITVGLETFETTDSNYDSGRAEWDCIAGPGCPQPSSDASFTGTIEQIVYVRDVSGLILDSVEGGALIPRASDKRSDIEGGSWDSSQQAQTVINTDTEYQYGTSGSPPADWEAVSDTTERKVQVGTVRDFFEVKEDDGFSSIVSSEAGWYPLRGDDASTSPPPSEVLSETRIRHVDPDDCLNCLPTENVSEAEARFENTTGAKLQSTSLDSWSRVSDEPAEIYDRREDVIDYRTFEATEGITSLIFENYTATDSERYLYREGENDRRRVYEWVNDDGTPQAEFERPEYDTATKYSRTVGDARYRFVGEVTSSRPLYQYGKELTETVNEYDSAQVWYDISQSYARVGDIDGFSVRFQGASQDYPVAGEITWNDDIHGVAPRDLTVNDIDDFCDSASDFDGLDRNVVTDPDVAGEGGDLVVEKCQNNGIERVVRIGKIFSEPSPEPYEAVFKLRAGSNIDTTPAYEVNVVGDTSCGVDTSSRGNYCGDTQPETPDLEDVEAINNRVDYNIGVVPITGEISSGVEELPEEYRVTVTPADDVDNVAGCTDISNYQERNRKQLQEETVSGDTLREFLNCEMTGFYDYELVPSEFEQYTKTYYTNGGDAEVEQKQIPKGAIQECRSPLKLGLSSSTVQQCIADSDTFEYLDTNKDVNFGGQYDRTTNGDLQPVDAGKLGRTCPNNYERNVETSLSDSPLVYSYESHSCELVSQPKFTLQSRQVTVEYENVRAGVVQSCTRIPTTSENEGNEHDGYVDVSDSSRDNKICDRVDNDDPGPDEFTLAEEVSTSDGGTRADYNQVPAGAFRGEQLTGTSVPSECTEARVEADGSMICEFEKLDGTTETVQYGTVVNGTWRSSSDTVTELKDQGEATKTIWNGDFVVDGSEEFTTTIDPEATIYEQKSGEAKFDVELRDSQGTVLETDTVNVRLCSAETVQSLPKSQPGPNECDRFDTMLNGYNETLKITNDNNYQDDPYSISDALNLTEYLSFGYGAIGGSSGSATVTIQTAAQDACPYTRRYPRDNGELIQSVEDYGDPGPFTYEIDSDTTREELETKVRDNLSAFYASNGNICEGKEVQNTPTPSRQDTNKQTLEFGKDAFVSPESRDFARIAGARDLKHHTEHPSQSLWADSELGNALRLGSPVLGPDESHKNLVALYPFDHDPSTTYFSTEFGGSYPNQYVVQDVYNHEFNSSIDGDETSSNKLDPDNHGVHQARLWYGSPCNTGEPSNDSIERQKLSSPQALDYRDFYYTDCPDNYRNTINGFSTELYGGLNVSRSEFHGEDFYTNPTGSVTTRFGPDRTEDAVANQSAFLYAPPSVEASRNFDADSNPHDATDYVSNNYGEGLFGSNSLKLDSASWLMLSPPCINQSKIESGVSASENLEQCNEPFDDDMYRGGFKEAYDDPDNLSDNADTREYSYNHDIGIQSDGSNSDYTIEFWVSDGETVGSDASYSRHPYSTLLAVGIPATGYQNPVGAGQASIHSSVQLNTIRRPDKINVSGLGGEFDGQQYASKTSRWMYGEHISLKNTFEHCLGTAPRDDHRPTLCDVYTESTGDQVGMPPRRGPSPGGPTMTAQYRSEDGYDSQYQDWYSVVYPKIEWKYTYEWALEGQTALRDTDFGGDPIFEKATLDNTETDCASSNNQQIYEDVLYEGENCYNDSTYAFSNGFSKSSPRPANYDDSTWTHVTLTYSEGTTQEPYRGLVTVYINGNSQGATPVGIQDCSSDDGGIIDNRCDGNGIHGDGSDTFDTGRFYEDSVIAIGGMYQDAAYTTNPNDRGLQDTGAYKPMLRASKGEIFIDELRVYNETVPPRTSRQASGSYGSNEPLATTIPRKTVTDELPTDDQVYRGSINTETLSEDEEGDSVSSEFGISRTMQVSVDAEGSGAYSIDIVPCDSNDCYPNAAANVNDSSIGIDSSSSVGIGPRRRGSINTGQSELSDKDAKVAFDRQTLDNQGVENIDRIKFDTRIGSTVINETPVINGIDIQPLPEPYRNCQDVMEEYSSFEGNPDTNVTFAGTLSGEEATVNCDFEKGEGGWTRFAWFDEGTYELDTFEDSTPLMSNVELSDCDVDDDACFATPKYFVPSNVNFSEYKYANSREDFNGQIMIKAVNSEGQTVDWAAFELDPYGNIRNGTGDYTDFSAEDQQEWLRKFKTDTLKPQDTKVNDSDDYAAYEGINKSNTTTSEPDSGTTENCMYSIGHGDNYDGGCISHYRHTVELGGTARFRIVEGSIEENYAGRTAADSPYYVSPEYTHLRVERDNSEQTIDTVTCLDRDVERCELYYKTGSVYDNSDISNYDSTSLSNQDNFEGSGPSGGSSISSSPTHYWSTYDSGQSAIPDIEGSSDLNARNQDVTASVEGHDGTSGEGVILQEPTTGDNIGLETGDQVIPTEDSFTISGWFHTNETGPLLSARSGRDYTMLMGVNGADNEITATIKYSEQGDCTSTSCRGQGVGGQGRVNSWNHFALTVNPSNDRIAMYINGQRENSRNFQGVDSPVLKSYDYFVAGYSPSGSRTYYSTMEEVMIFNKELSESEISTIAQDGYRYKNQ